MLSMAWNILETLAPAPRTLVVKTSWSLPAPEAAAVTVQSGAVQPMEAAKPAAHAATRLASLSLKAEVALRVSGDVPTTLRADWEQPAAARGGGGG